MQKGKTTASLIKICYSFPVQQFRFKSTCWTSVLGCILAPIIPPWQKMTGYKKIRSNFFFRNHAYILGQHKPGYPNITPNSKNFQCPNAIKLDVLITWNRLFKAAFPCIIISSQTWDDLEARWFFFCHQFDAYCMVRAVKNKPFADRFSYNIRSSCLAVSGAFPLIDSGT